MTKELELSIRELAPEKFLFVKFISGGPRYGWVLLLENDDVWNSSFEFHIPRDRETNGAWMHSIDGFINLASEDIQQYFSPSSVLPLPATGKAAPRSHSPKTFLYSRGISSFSTELKIDGTIPLWRKIQTLILDRLRDSGDALGS